MTEVEAEEETIFGREVTRDLDSPYILMLILKN
jgi:hypothetical protein